MSKEVETMFDSIAARYDCANDVLSFGIHRMWRKQAVREAEITAGERVVDLCCGTGDFARTAALAAGPGGSVLALDFSAPMLALAVKKVPQQSAAPIHFIRGDALSIPLPDSWADCATIAFGIRNVDNPSSCLLEMKRVLRPGGRALILEFGRPRLPVFAQAYKLYSRFLMPSLGGALTGNRSAYRYLPETSSQFAAGQDFVALLKEAGFIDAHCRPILSGLAYIYISKRPLI